jgi:hypothetical protein
MSWLTDTIRCMADSGEAGATTGSSALLPLLSWWGGYFVGPLLGGVAFLSEPKGSLARSHGGAAALVWTAVLVVWAPFSAWVILFGGADPSALLIGAPIVLVLTLGACINGSIQVRRGRTPSGRQPDGPS